MKLYNSYISKHYNNTNINDDTIQVLKHINIRTKNKQTFLRGNVHIHPVSRTVEKMEHPLLTIAHYQQLCPHYPNKQNSEIPPTP